MSNIDLIRVGIATHTRHRHLPTNQWIEVKLQARNKNVRISVGSQSSRKPGLKSRTSGGGGINKRVPEPRNCAKIWGPAGRIDWGWW